MDREPKERVIFDESVYYGDAGEEIAIESLMASEDLTEAEVRAAFIDSQIFERAMEMMDRDRTVELEGLSAFFDGDKSDQSSFVNPLGGNRIIARGSVGRWDGTSHGLTAYRDFDDMMRGADSVFKDCELDISGTPYTVPVDVLKGLKDAVRSAECAATVTAYSALTIAEWNQKGDESRWALDFEDRNGFPPQLSDYLARDAKGDADGLDLDMEAHDMRGVADVLASRQVESPGLDGRDR